MILETGLGKRKIASSVKHTVNIWAHKKKMYIMKKFTLEIRENKLEFQQFLNETWKKEMKKEQKPKIVIPYVSMYIGMGCIFF